MFLIVLKYKCELDDVDKHVSAHRKFLDKYYSLNKFICSGAQQPRNGGVILCNADSKNAVEQIITEDPFFICQVADYEVIEFDPTKYAPAFEPFIQKK